MKTGTDSVIGYSIIEIRDKFKIPRLFLEGLQVWGYI